MYKKILVETVKCVDGESNGMTVAYVYMLECSDGSYYTGYTTDLSRRVEEHNSGNGAKYTKSRTPVDLVYFEKHPSKSDAMSREYEIKQLSRSQKESLVNR